MGHYQPGDPIPDTLFRGRAEGNSLFFLYEKTFKSMKKKDTVITFWLKAMRVTGVQILMTILLAGVAMARGTAQEMLQKRISISFEKTALPEAILKLGEQAKVDITFNSAVLPKRSRVSASFREQTLESVLTSLLSPYDVSFLVVEDQVILRKQKKGKKELSYFPEILRETGIPDRRITGIVTDEKGEPLPGVNILVQGTQRGTATGSDGRFSMDIPDEEVVMVFSFVGYVTREVTAGNITNLEIALEVDEKSLDEVVVVGYGTTRKEAVTGAVTRANLDAYREVPANNILESIKGSVAGLNIGGVNSAGQVGSLSIRGQNSTSADNTPLIVVDGAIFYGNLADIAPQDIDNMTVLKDASAAAVYGARSANGVIIINTKSGGGISGKPKFDIKMSYGVSDQLNPLKIYDAKGYLQRLLDVREANGQEANPDNIRSYLQVIEQRNYDATPDHRATLPNPFDLTSRLGHVYNTSFGISNSTEKTNYYISTSLIKQKGVILNDDFKLVSGRVNIDSDLTSWFNLGVKSSYSLRDYSGDAPSMYWATMFSPYASVYNEDGSYSQYPQTTAAFISPFWEIATEDTERNNNLSGVLTGTVKIPGVEGLTFQSTFSNLLRWNENHQFFNERTTTGASRKGYGYRLYDRYHNMLLDNMLKYNRVFSRKHSVDATLLFSREHSSWQSLQASAQNFDNTSLGTYALENCATQTVETGGGETDAFGLMARATYSYQYKYSVTGTIRRDGYSAFSKNRKWGVFPSVGVNWNISKEGFMQEVGAINNLALRVSYGKNGNRSIDPYTTLAKIATGRYVFYGDGGTYPTVTQYISSLANNDLSWESTTGLNIGADFSLLNRRISGSVDYYQTKTNDLLFNLSVPTTTGMTSITSNIGEIANKGIELNLHTENIERTDFRWSSDFAFSLNRNKVVSILGKDTDGDGREDDLISDGYFIGRSLGTIYDYRVTGMWQQADVDNGSIMTGMRAGDYKLEDADGSGTITSDKDRQFIGNTNPNFRWSWTNNFSYRDLSLMFYFYSVWGGSNWYLSGNNDPYHDAYVSNEAVNRPVYDYWTPANTGAEFPRPDYSSRAPYKGTKYIDRSFVKLQKVALTYNLSKLVNLKGINGLSCSLSADNLFTFAPRWMGLDPETDSGLSNTSIPSIRTYLLVVSLNF